MTKYGHKSVSIAISQLKAGIDDKYYLSMSIIQIHVFSIPIYRFLTLTTACQAKRSHL